MGAGNSKLSDCDQSVRLLCTAIVTASWVVILVKTIIRYTSREIMTNGFHLSSGHNAANKGVLCSPITIRDAIKLDAGVSVSQD